MEKNTYNHDEAHEDVNGGQDPTSNARRFGMRSESRPLHHDHQQSDNSEIHKDNAISSTSSESKERETTAWEVYNKRAAIVDRELIKDWNDGLNTLLIFAALYSAVLTAFIMESMKLLEEDPTETTRDILAQLSRQMANNSLPAYDYNPNAFTAPTWAVRVNYYFFISISSSLVAALGAVLALQWVGNYDAGLNTSSPKDRALQRHFRSIGTENYKLHQIVAFLPLLIFLALLLFFIGLSDWLWHLNQGVGAVVIFGLACGAMFYMITTGISMVRVAAPFRTPVSKAMPMVLWQLFHPLGALARLFTPRGLMRAARGSKRLLSAHKIFQDFLTDVFFGSVRAVRSLRNVKNFAQEKPFTERERSVVSSDSTLEPRSLLWIAKSIDILPHQHTNFVVILKAFTELPVQQLLSLSLSLSPSPSQPPAHSVSNSSTKKAKAETQLDDAPWLEIFKLLTRNFRQKSSRRDYNEEELKQATFFAQSLAIIGNGSCTDPHSNATDPQIRSFLISLFFDTGSDDVKSRGVGHGELSSHTDLSLDLTEQYAKQALWRQWARHKRQDWHEIIVVQGRKLVGWKWAINIGIRALCPFISPSLQQRSSSRALAQSQPQLLESRPPPEPRHHGSQPQLLVHGLLPSKYILFQMLSYQAEQKARPSLLEDETIEVLGKLCDISEDHFAQVKQSDLLPQNIFNIVLTMFATHLLQHYPHPEYHEHHESGIEDHYMAYLRALESTIVTSRQSQPVQSNPLTSSTDPTVPSQPALSILNRDQISIWGRVHVSVQRQLLARTALATRYDGTSDSTIQEHLDILLRLVNSPLWSQSTNPHSKSFTVPREMLLLMSLNPRGYWAVPNSPKTVQVFSKSIFPTSSSPFNFDLNTALANGDNMLEKGPVANWAAWFSEVMLKMDDLLDEQSERDQLVLIEQLKQVAAMVKSKMNVEKSRRAKARAGTRVGDIRNVSGITSADGDEVARVPLSFSVAIPVTMSGDREHEDEKDGEMDSNYENSYKIDKLQQIRSLPLSLIASLPVDNIWNFPSFEIFEDQGREHLEHFDSIESYASPSDSTFTINNDNGRSKNRKKTLQTIQSANSLEALKSLLHDPLFENVFIWWSRYSSDNLHSSAIPFIRTLVLHGSFAVKMRVNFLFPYWEYVNGKRFNSQQAHELFGAPALNILLAHAVEPKPSANSDDSESTPGSLLVQLNTFNSFEWFTREFTKADGFKWLEERIFPNSSSQSASRSAYLSQPVSSRFGTGSWAATTCFDLIRYSTIPIVRHEELLAWVTFTKKLLVLCGDLRDDAGNGNVGEGDKKGNEARGGSRSSMVVGGGKGSKQGPSKMSLEETATTFREILRQQEERRNGSEPTPQKFEAGLVSWRLVNLPPPNERFEYVSSWSEQEWDSWTHLMHEVIAGLSRGYIHEQ